MAVSDEDAFRMSGAVMRDLASARDGAAALAAALRGPDGEAADAAEATAAAAQEAMRACEALVRLCEHAAMGYR